MRIFCLAIILMAAAASALAQTTTEEKRVPLSDAAVAFDGTGGRALEGNLRTTALNGAIDSPVTNIRVVIKNASGTSYALVTGLITFYDAAGVRCGEGMFKAGSLAVDEAFETDAPGVRIRCSAATWRMVATDLLPRVPPMAPLPTVMLTRPNLLISVDGDEHPVQLDRPLVVNLGNAQRTIVVRQAP